MVSARYTQVTTQADDLEEPVRFYEPAFGMERLPTPGFEEPIEWLRCGELQLHVIETEAEPPSINHYGLHVDGFEGVYRAVEQDAGAEFEALPTWTRGSSTAPRPSTSSRRARSGSTSGTRRATWSR